MGSLPLNEILTRLDELRAVFVLGQRAMPFIEEVLSFLREIVPVLDEVDQSIRMSTQSMMPKATSRLASVTQATELATTEIMDLIDEAYGKLERSQEKIAGCQSSLEALAAADARLLDLIETRIDEPALVTAMQALLQEKAQHRDAVTQALSEKTTTLNEIRNNLNNIMMSLQVQDITSQQIASVSHLIESVRDLLQKFEGQLGSGSLEAFLDPTPPENVTFDGNASYDRTGQKQAAADEVIASFGSDPAPESPAAQGDIDDLFDNPPAEPASQDDIDALFGNTGSASEPASQGDIDALFGNAGSTPEPASQGDIDALFANPSAGGAGEPASQGDIDALFGEAPSGDGANEPASQDDIDNLFKNSL